MCQEYISYSKHALKEVGNTLAGPSTDIPSWGDHSPPTHNMTRITITEKAEYGQENKGNLELPESRLQGVSKIDKVIIINRSSSFTIC